MKPEGKELEKNEDALQDVCHLLIPCPHAGLTDAEIEREMAMREGQKFEEEEDPLQESFEMFPHHMPTVYKLARSKHGVFLCALRSTGFVSCKILPIHGSFVHKLAG